MHPESPAQILSREALYRHHKLFPNQPASSCICCTNELRVTSGWCKSSVTSRFQMGKSFTPLGHPFLVTDASQHKPAPMVTHQCAMTLWLLATSVTTVYHTFALIWLDVSTSHVYTNHYVNGASLQNWKRANDWKCVQSSRANWLRPNLRRRYVCGLGGGCTHCAHSSVIRTPLSIWLVLQIPKSKARLLQASPEQC